MFLVVSPSACIMYFWLSNTNFFIMIHILINEKHLHVYLIKYYRKLIVRYADFKK